MKKILIIGSLNMDSVIETPYMPKAGETITGKGISLVPGGKGANQAYAVGKLGGCVGMIGAVGKDSFGQALKENLESVNVNTRGIEVLDGKTTGQAYITVDERGENSIILIPGTNALVTKSTIERHEDLIRESDIIIMQLEIPIDTVEYVKKRAIEFGKQIIVDPAPALSGLPDTFWQGIDYIKPNETELSILVGKELRTKEELCEGAREMLRKGVKKVIVTLGGKGCLYVDKTETIFFPAKKVEAVDTTAAGDSFTAGFALALARGDTYEDAIRFGQSVSAITVTRKGAQTSIPTLDEVEQEKQGR